MKGSAIKRGYLGVGIQPMTDDIADGLGLPKDAADRRRVEPASRRSAPASSRAT
jgi:serine protease Do